MPYDIYADIIDIRADDSVFMMPLDAGIQKIEIGKTILVPRLAMAQGKGAGGSQKGKGLYLDSKSPHACRE